VLFIRKGFFTMESTNSSLKLEHLTFPFEFEKKGDHDDEDDDMVRVTGYASTFNNKDFTNDVIERGAFAKTLKGKSGKNIKILWQHDAHKPIGRIIKAVEDEKGLFIKAVMPKEHSLVKDVVALIKADIINRMSIGFQVEDSDISRSGVRTLKEINLFEVSFVTFPANEKAEITDIKSVIGFKDLPLADSTYPWDRVEALKRVRKFIGSEDLLSDKYADSFFWFNEADPNALCIYKLAFADVIDGKLMAIPRAIFESTAILLGARGGVDIPSSDRPSVIRHVEQYYKKMGRESPFQDNKCWDLDHAKSMTKEDIFYFLKQAKAFGPEDLRYFMERFIERKLERNGDICFKQEKSTIIKEITAMKALLGL